MSHLSTIRVFVLNCHIDATFAYRCISLFSSPHAGMGPHVREGVKKHDTHVEPKSYKFELLGKLVI